MIDLLAAVAILLFAASLVLGQMSGLGRAREMANRAKCANNLRQIGFAFKMYATNTTQGLYPRGPYTPGAPLTQFTAKANDGHIFDGDVQANDCTVPLFLLLRQDMVSSVMVCPSTNGTPDLFGAAMNNANNRSNFTSPNNLSYSMQCPYPSTTTNTFVWKDNGSINADFAIAADISPGASGNSRNHGGEGQNVLYGDIHIQWQARPICGKNNDNIYTYGPSPDEKGKWSMAAGAGPADNGDSFLLPATIDPWATTGPSDSGSTGRKPDSNALTIILIIAGVLAAAGVAVAVWYWNKKRNWAPPMVG